MALSFVGYASAAASSVALPSYDVGDIALVFAFRDGSNTAPSLASDYTSVAFSGGASSSSRVGYRVLSGSETTTGTWTNATEVQVIVLRGQDAGDPIGGFQGGGAGGQTLIEYEGYDVEAPSTSWTVGFGGHRTATDANAGTISGWTNRSSGSSTSSLSCHTDATPSDFDFVFFDVNASSAFRSYAIEVRAAVQTSTGEARISLAAGDVPETQTDHVLYVRARQTDSGHSGTLAATLYEGATPRSSALEIASLTTSFVTYALAIPDEEAETIGSYADLEVRLSGASLAGDPITLEIAEVWLSLPFAAAGEQFGLVSFSSTATVVASGVVTSGGATSTGVGRVSLDSAFVPLTRTDHKIVSRARVTNGAHTGTIRAQLYEGGTAVGSELESDELTSSLASYDLALPDVDAADIGSYADLEIRFRGYSSTGDAATFEVAELYLSIPEPSSEGGEVTGAAVLQSIASISVLGGSPIFPSTDVYPQRLASARATATISVEHSSDIFGAASLSSTATIVPSGDQPPGNRTGLAALPSTVTISVDSEVARLGAAVLASTAIVSAGADTLGVVGAAALSSTATISVDSHVGEEVDGSVSLTTTATVRARWRAAGVADLPDPLVDYAFDDPPQTYTPVWSSLAERVRGLSTKRGRSYEFDRFESGTSAHLLDNRDAGLNPENTESPYYPLRSTRPYRVRFAWGGAIYPAFRGISDGYPQAFPGYGEDAVVQGDATDLFLALNQARFAPGSTVLTEALSIVPEPTEGEEPDLEALVRVDSTELPLPQAVPFVVEIAGLTPEWPTEEVEVLEIVDSTTWRVRRSETRTWEHPIGAAVTTTVVSFGEELSGTRIQRVLDRIGFSSEWYDLDAGQTLIAASDDLADTSPLEHILLIAEAEFGRFFVSRDGRYAFRDRHASYLDYLDPVIRFSDSPSATGDPDEVLYSLGGDVEHSEEKLYNRVRITIPSGEVADVSDAAAIAQHYERIFERQWPYARIVDAEAAALWVLRSSLEHSLRIPSIVIKPVKDPDLWWPLVLEREIGDRGEFVLAPLGDGDPIQKEVVIDGIEHVRGPGRHEVRFSVTETDPNEYWILGVAGYSELGETTWLAF